MQPIYSLREPIGDVNEYRSQLADLQANILHNHARRHVAHIFLRFKEDAALHILRRRVAGLAYSVNSAWDDIVCGTNHGLFTGVCLAKSGYDLLHVPTAGFIAEFKRGMKGSAHRLGIVHDPWESHLSDPHMLVIVGHHDFPTAAAGCENVKDRFFDIAEIFTEWGHVISDTPGGRPREHFGFLDGLSQPRFIRNDRDPPPVKWDDAAGPWLVLAQVEAGMHDVGSYYVYWKLEQDVDGFNAAVESLAAQLGVTTEVAGAFVFGRFKDGTPVAGSAVACGTPVNDFDYSHDSAGRFCPIFAHIRKMNPRGTSGTELATERGRRIARRGIPYGYNPELESRHGDGIGLLFQSCQGDIARQFEHLVTMWGKDRDFPRVDDGSDPLLGPAHTPQRWPEGYGGSGVANHIFRSCVKSRGGAYFFLPGKAFLAAIDTLP
jgi:Dyp-type peroxidase family